MNIPHSNSHSNYDVIHRLAPQVRGLQSNLLIINERKRDRLEEPLVSSIVATHRKSPWCQHCT